MNAPVQLPPGPATDLARQECDLRVRVDALRGEITMMEIMADRLLERMRRIGQRSWYVGRIPR